MIAIVGERPNDWILMCAASAVSWCARVGELEAQYGALPLWARMPPQRDSVRYQNDTGVDLWTFGAGETDGRHEGAEFDIIMGDCDTLMAAGAGARLHTTGEARILTVAKDGKGHTFETATKPSFRGYKLRDMSVEGGMTPLSRAEYNLPANVATIKRVSPTECIITVMYGIPPLTDL